MTPCMMLSGVLLALGVLIAAKGRTEGVSEREQRLGARVVYAALVVMAFGVVTGN
jgi:hypothetical protein